MGLEQGTEPYLVEVILELNPSLAFLCMESQRQHRYHLRTKNVAFAIHGWESLSQVLARVLKVHQAPPMKSALDPGPLWKVRW